MKFPKTLSTLIGSFIVSSIVPMSAATFIAMTPTPAHAATSCWGTSDPPGCWLQCSFGGPCPLEKVKVREGFENVRYKLLSQRSEAYQQALESMKKRSKMDAESFNRNRVELKRPLRQICEPEKLLAVMGETLSPRKVAGTCFK